jgi:hypothetical protein
VLAASASSFTSGAGRSRIGTAGSENRRAHSANGIARCANGTTVFMNEPARIRDDRVEFLFGAMRDVN